MIRLLALAAKIAVLASPSLTSDRITLEPVSVPAPLLSQGKVNTVVEASGVQLVGNRGLALVAHDKQAPLHVLNVATGELVGEPIASPRFLAASKQGPKWEGMARDSDGNIYLIGSHGGATDEERTSHSVLLRFRLTEGPTPGIDDASVMSWDISQTLVAALKAAGVADAGLLKRKIEGLTIRETNGVRELVIGMRSPTDQVRVLVADVTSTPDGTELPLKPLFHFAAGMSEGEVCELTSLEYVPSLKGFLIVTATEDDFNVFHGNTLWFVADGATTQAQPIARFEVAMKAEGLAVLDSASGDGQDVIRLLMVYDNDSLKTKIPSRFQTFRLIRETR